MRVMIEPNNSALTVPLPLTSVPAYIYIYIYVFSPSFRAFLEVVEDRRISPQS